MVAERGTGVVWAGVRPGTGSSHSHSPHTNYVITNKRRQLKLQGRLRLDYHL